jgi:hypothetical protein
MYKVGSKVAYCNVSIFSQALIGAAGISRIKYIGEWIELENGKLFTLEGKEIKDGSDEYYFDTILTPVAVHNKLIKEKQEKNKRIHFVIQIQTIMANTLMDQKFSKEHKKELIRLVRQL